jgi:hypothetical protein
MAEIVRLPGSVNLEVGVDDLLTVGVFFKQDGNPVDISAWTLEINNAELTLINPQQGYIQLIFQSDRPVTQRWSLTRTSFPEKRLLTGCTKYLRTGAPSTTGATVQVTLSDEAEVVVDLLDVAEGPQGPTGPLGPTGPTDQISFRRIASGAIGGQRMVKANPDGTVSYASASDVDHAGKVLGMTDFAVADGEQVVIIREGLVEFEGFNFDVGLPVYLGENGLVTQTASPTGFSQIVGFAENPTNLFVNLREPIIL